MKYTVFCRQDNNLGTTWIDTVEFDGEPDLEAISELAVKKCAEEWGQEDSADILCIGIAPGDIAFLFWEDIE